MRGDAENREREREVCTEQRGDARGRSQGEALFPAPGYVASVLLTAFVKSLVLVPPERNFISFCEEPKGSARVREYVCQTPGLW